jgi:predicted kinase
MGLVILTGASGSGKTTIARAIERRYPGLATVFFFDSIGVPSAERRLAEYGSDGEWQRAMTLRWMQRIAAVPQQDRSVLFEGQSRLAFLQEGIVAAGLTDARIVLLDCDDTTRTRRLEVDRRQPELANPTMMNWAKFLRAEAERAGCEILDTSHATLEACIERVCALLR